MCYGPSGLLTIQLDPYTFLAQNCIELEFGQLNFKTLYHPRLAFLAGLLILAFFL